MTNNISLSSLSSPKTTSKRLHYATKNAHKENVFTSISTLPPNNRSVLMQQTSFSSSTNNVKKNLTSSFKTLKTFQNKEKKEKFVMSTLPKNLSYYRYPTPCGSSMQIDNSFDLDLLNIPKIKEENLNIEDEKLIIKNFEDSQVFTAQLPILCLAESKLNNNYGMSKNKLKIKDNIKNRSLSSKSDSLSKFTNENINGNQKNQVHFLYIKLTFLK